METSELPTIAGSVPKREVLQCICDEFGEQDELDVQRTRQLPDARLSELQFGPEGGKLARRQLGGQRLRLPLPVGVDVGVLLKPEVDHHELRLDVVLAEKDADVPHLGLVQLAALDLGGADAPLGLERGEFRVDRVPSLT